MGIPRLVKSTIEKWVIHYTNEEREAADLKALIHDPSISDIARAHSEDMIQFRFSHDINGRGPTDRAIAAGYSCRYYFADGSYTSTSGLAENIFEYPRVKMWLGYAMKDHARGAEP